MSCAECWLPQWAHLKVPTWHWQEGNSMSMRWNGRRACENTSFCKLFKYLHKKKVFGSLVFCHTVYGLYILIQNAYTWGCQTVNFHQTLSSFKGCSVLWQGGCSCSAICTMKWSSPDTALIYTTIEFKVPLSSHNARKFRHFVLSRGMRKRILRQPTVRVSTYFCNVKMWC